MSSIWDEAELIVEENPQPKKDIWAEAELINDAPKKDVWADATPVNQPIKPANQELVIEQPSGQELNPNAKPSDTQLQGGVEKKYVEQDGYYVDTETGDKIPIGGAEIRKPDDLTALNPKQLKNYLKSQDAVKRSMNWERIHNAIPPILRDYDFLTPIFKHEDKYQATHPQMDIKDQITQRLKGMAGSVSGLVNIGLLGKTWGMPSMAKQGAIVGAGLRGGEAYDKALSGEGSWWNVPINSTIGALEGLAAGKGFQYGSKILNQIKKNPAKFKQDLFDEVLPEYQRDRVLQKLEARNAKRAAKNNTDNTLVAELDNTNFTPEDKTIPTVIDNTKPQITNVPSMAEQTQAIIKQKNDDLVKDLGLDNVAEEVKPEYSKEMRDEAISIISNATGKKPEYIQMIAKAQSGGKGIKTKNSKLQELLEGGSENITANGSANNYKYYNKNGMTYDTADIEGGYNTIQQAWDDLVNDNFYLNKEENQYNNMLNGAENKVKSALKNILENPNDYENKLAQHSEDVAKYLDENVPEDARQYFYDNFYNGLDKIDNHLKEVKGLQDGSIKPSKLNQSDLGKEVNAQATYDVLHNKDLINQASVEANKEGAFGNLLGRTLNPKEEMSALDFETGRQLATKLLQEGKTQDGLNLIEGLANKASKAGQAVQALSLWSKVTPEGAILQAEKLINNYNKNASKKLPKLTEQQAQDILKLQENIANQTDDRARDIATAQLLKYQAELIPQSAWQKVKTLRNISLLLNPKTLVRNIVGNGAFALNEVGAKALADFIDTGLSMVTKTKTRSMPKLNAMWKGLKQGTKEGIEDVNLGIDTRGGIGARYDLPNTRSFKNGVLGQLEKALDYGLRVPDRTFYQGVYNESVANQLAAKGLKEVTPEIAERARQEALEAVFQNDGKLSNTVLGLRKALNKIGNEDFGLGDWLIPYAQTPANLVQQGINYSPLGFIKGAMNLAKNDQRQASLDLARAILGTGMLGGGYALSKSGVGQGAVDDYQTKKNLEAEGIRPFTINGVSFNQIQPNAVPITAGMALANPSSKGALNDALETITDLSMLDNLKQFNKDRENYGTLNAGLRQLAGLPSQFVGTGVNQINAFVDPYQRETYDPNIAKQGLNKLMAKTPGASYLLPKATDVKGEEIKKYADSPNQLAKAVDVFLNPVFINKKKNNPVLKEVIRLNSDANKTLLPIAEKKLKFTQKDGNEFNKTLTSKEYVAYKNKLSKETYDNLAELMNTELYQNADDSQKADLINKLEKDVKDRVQQDIFNKASKKDKPKISRYERKKKRYLNKQLKSFIDENYGGED